MASKTSTTETVKETYKEELVQPERAILTDTQRFDVLRDGTIVGSAKGDIFFGDAKTGTTYKGGKGDDTMLSSPGGVLFDGGEGSDTVDYSASKGGVTVDLEAGTGERGDAKGDTYKEVENVIGTKYDDILIGNDQRNVLEGGEGDDVFLPGFGNSSATVDQIDGGEGFDTIDASGYSHGIHVDMWAGTLNKIGDEGEYRKVDFENIEGVIGTDHDDTFEAWAFATSFSGRGGNDTFIVTRDIDFSFHGGGGKDTLDMGSLNGRVTYDFAADELQDYETGEKLGDLTSLEVLIATNGNNVIINDADLREVYARNGSDTFVTTNLDFDLYDGGNPADIDTISFALADGPLGWTPQDAINTNYLHGKVQNVEKIIGTDFDDTLPYFIYKQYGGGGNDTFHFSQSLVDAIPSAEWAGGVIPNYDPLVEFDGGTGIDTLTVSFGSDSAVIDLQGGPSHVDGQDAEIRDIEHLNISGLDVTINGNDADNTIVLFEYDIFDLSGEEFWDQATKTCNATVSAGAGNDTVEMIFGKYRTGTETLEYDGGQGTDTLSYATTQWEIFEQASIASAEQTTWGVEIDVDNGTVQERREGDAGETHTFQSVESFRGTQMADRFVDGEGSQTYEGVNAFYDLFGNEHEWNAATAQDTFVFSNDFSDSGDVDTILDFTAGEDLLDLSGTNRDSWAEVLDGNWEQVGNNTVLDLGNGHDLVLQNVQFSSLSDTDFIF